MIKRGGADRDRTDDLLSAIQALSQLSYSPTLHEIYRRLDGPSNSGDGGAYN